MDDKPVLATITGECFQPVRLHYRVVDGQGLLQAFKKLRCVEHDPKWQRWVWLYDHEAKGLKFKKSYAQISKDLRPIVLGSFFQRTSDTLLLDLRSFERAKQAIPFFDKHIPRSAAKVTAAEVANKLYSVADNPQLSPEDVFDHRDSTIRDPEAEMQRLGELAAQARGPQARLDIALKAIQSAAGQPLPAIERIPIHYYEDGIQAFTLVLNLRQIVAIEHWTGNTGYTLSDAIKSTMKLR
jgi:hypothetical protein